MIFSAVVAVATVVVVIDVVVASVVQECRMELKSIEHKPIS